RCVCLLREVAQLGSSAAERGIVRQNACAYPLSNEDPLDRHLSVFLPYDRPPHHEDQLTRAAMIVMRTTPLARDALLARVGAPPSARLPEAELDIQARDVLKVPVSSTAEGRTLRRLISVFLSPDIGLDLSGTVIGERIGEQRLDGVLRFGDELVVVIES